MFLSFSLLPVGAAPFHDPAALPERKQVFGKRGCECEAQGRVDGQNGRHAKYAFH